MTPIVLVVWSPMVNEGTDARDNLVGSSIMKTSRSSVGEGEATLIDLHVGKGHGLSTEFGLYEGILARGSNKD